MLLFEAIYIHSNRKKSFYSDDLSVINEHLVGLFCTIGAG